MFQPIVEGSIPICTCRSERVVDARQIRRHRLVKQNGRPDASDGRTIAVPEPLTQSACRFLRQAQVVPHATAGIEEEPDVDRRISRREVRNVLPPSFFENGKVSRGQVGHVAAGSIGDRHRQRHELHARFESARLGQQRVRPEIGGSEDDAHHQDHARTECFVHG